MKTKTTVLAPNAKAIVRNLVLLQDGSVLAGYRIGARRWDFTGQDTQASLITQEADVFGSLAGRSMHLRISTRPHPIQTWARQLDLRTPHPTPDVHTCGETMSKADLLHGRCGCETWNGHLVRMQSRIGSTGMDDKVVFRYFSVGKVSSRVDLRKRVLEYIETGKAHASIANVIADEKRVLEIVKHWPGSRRMNEFEQGWLRVRSLAPGLQPSSVSTANRDGGWDQTALPVLANDIRWNETPFGRTVQVHSFADGKHQVTATRVLTLARLTDMNYPANGLAPWLVQSESLPFSVDWSIVGRIRTPEEMTAEVELDLRKALYVKRDYDSHGELPPSVIKAGILVARNSRDQVTTGQATEAARFQGQVNAIVSGRARVDPATGEQVMTAEEVCEERAALFVRMYSSAGFKMDFTGADCQSYMLRSTVPGEPYDTVGYQRRLRLPMLAAGMPSVSNTVGDGKGPYIGHTRGTSPRPVMHDPHFATEGRKTGRGQNVHLVVGTLGSGKSVLLGTTGYQATRRGIRTVISDPSGPLAQLCRMPEIAAVSQEVNLLHGRRGILNPPGLIRNPVAEDFDVPGQWADAMAQARAERRDLTVDMALRSCPADLYANPATRAVLQKAARAHQDHHSWETGSTIWDLMLQLRAMAEVGDDWADAVHGALRDASTAPLLSLMFPPEGQDAPIGQYDKTLTVITMPGIVRAPDGVDRHDWNPQEVGADAVLRLVSLFTDRLIYAKSRNERCVAIFDEAETLTDTGPGRSALSRLGRDHSKHNIAVYLGVKTINEKMLSGELKNFLASVFVGRMAGRVPATLALEVLGLSDSRYADTLLNLSTHTAGEFVHLDVEGSIAGIKVDVDYHPGLKEALLTDPTPEGSSAWMLDEEDAR